MGLLDKLMFWKHREETFELPKDLEMSSLEAPSLEAALPPLPGAEAPLRPAEPSFGVQPITPAGGVPVEKELQIIAAKLDTIKANLETINIKIDKLERKEEVRWR